MFVEMYECFVKNESIEEIYLCLVLVPLLLYHTSRQTLLFFFGIPYKFLTHGDEKGIKETYNIYKNGSDEFLKTTKIKIPYPSEDRIKKTQIFFSLIMSIIFSFMFTLLLVGMTNECIK